MSSALPYSFNTDRAPQIGLVVLQSDETIEEDFRAVLPRSLELCVTRVPSATEVSSDSLAEMKRHLTGAASLFPQAARMSTIGYGCTSGTAEIGAPAIAKLVRDGFPAETVTEPVSALVAACRAMGIKRLGMLSPYVAEVSAKLVDTLGAQGITTPVFGSFEEAQEARVVRIDAPSIINAARNLAAQGGIDAMFLSCTNLRTFDVIDTLEADLGMPVLSSNLVLSWHMIKALDPAATGPGRLWNTPVS